MPQPDLNFSKGQLALNCFRDVLAMYLDTVVYLIHQSLLQQPQPQPPHCHGHVCQGVHKKINRPTWTFNGACQPQQCTANHWLTTLKAMHINPNQVDNRNFKAELWPTDHWQVALFFMGAGHSCNTTAASTDVSGLVAVTLNCKDIKAHFSQQDQDALKEVRVWRNKLAHCAAPVLTDQELQQLMTSVAAALQLPQLHQPLVQHTLKQIMSVADVQLQEDIELIQESKLHAAFVDQAIQDIQCFDQEKFDAAEILRDRLVEWKQHRTNLHPDLHHHLKLLESRLQTLQTRLALQQRYQQQDYQHTRPCPGASKVVLDVDAVFVPVTVAAQQPSINTGQHSMDYDHDEGEILSNICDVFNVMEKGSRTVIEGQAGAGKSTVLQKYCRLWGTSEPQAVPLNQFSMFLHMPVVSIQTNIIRSLYGRLLQQSSLTVDGFTTVCTSCSYPALLVLDGADEANPAQKQVINDVLEHKLFPDWRVVVSSRPGFITTDQVNKYFRIKGFLREQQLQYVNNYFSIVPLPESITLSKIVKFFKRPEITEVCNGPMLTSAMCNIAAQGKIPVIKTRLDLYIKIFEYLHSHADTKPEIKSWGVDRGFLILQNLSYECLVYHDSYSITEQLVKQQYPEQSEIILNVLPQLGATSTQHIFLDQHQEVHMNFYHKTICEHLAACHLSEMPLQQLQESVMQLIRRGLQFSWLLAHTVSLCCKRRPDAAVAIFRRLTADVTGEAVPQIAGGEQKEVMKGLGLPVNNKSLNLLTALVGDVNVCCLNDVNLRQLLAAWSRLVEADVTAAQLTLILGHNPQQWPRQITGQDVLVRSLLKAAVLGHVQCMAVTVSSNTTDILLHHLPQMTQLTELSVTVYTSAQLCEACRVLQAAGLSVLQILGLRGRDSMNTQGGDLSPVGDVIRALPRLRHVRLAYICMPTESHWTSVCEAVRDTDRLTGISVRQCKAPCSVLRRTVLPAIRDRHQDMRRVLVLWKEGDGAEADFRRLEADLKPRVTGKLEVER